MMLMTFFFQSLIAEFVGCNSYFMGLDENKFDTIKL